MAYKLYSVISIVRLPTLILDFTKQRFKIHKKFVADVTKKNHKNFSIKKVLIILLKNYLDKKTN